MNLMSTQNQACRRTATAQTRLQSPRPLARRVGTQGNRQSPSTKCPDSWPSARNTARQAAQGRAHHRFAAHDHRDRHPHRDARGPRRVRALGQLQHLLHAGPRRRRDRKAGIPVFACKGESLEEYWEFTLDALTHPGRQRPATHRGRRRRRHAAHPQRL